MDIQLSPAAAAALEHLLARGFATPAEAIEAAILAFEAAAPEDDWDDEYTAEVVAKVAEGLADIEAGRSRPMTADVREEIRRRALERLAAERLRSA